MNMNQPPQVQPGSRQNDFFSAANGVILLILGIIIGFLISSNWLALIREYLPQLLLSLVLLIGILAALVILLVVKRRWVFHKVFGVDEIDLNEVKNSAIGLPADLANQDFPAAQQKARYLVSTGVSWYAQISFRRWMLLIIQVVFLGLGGLLGTLLLFNQNELIKQQSELIGQQVHLQEADRRSALVFLMGNILDKVDEETAKLDENGKRVDTLSLGLIARIAALSEGFRPYRFYEDSTLTDKAYSPERGQLLLSLVNQGLDSSTMLKIYSKATFQNSYLRKANLYGVNMNKADLTDSDFSQSNLMGASLVGAQLSGTTFDEANLEQANLQNAIIWTASFNKAQLWGANLNAALFIKASLRNADLSGTNLSEAVFVEADLRNAQLGEADLTGAFFQGVDLIGAYISYDQALSCRTLYKSKGLNPALLSLVEVLNPELLRDLPSPE